MSSRKVSLQELDALLQLLTWLSNSIFLFIQRTSRQVGHIRKPFNLKAPVHMKDKTWLLGVCRLCCSYNIQSSLSISSSFIISSSFSLITSSSPIMVSLAYFMLNHTPPMKSRRHLSVFSIHELAYLVKLWISARPSFGLTFLYSAYKKLQLFWLVLY